MDMWNGTHRERWISIRTAMHVVTSTGAKYRSISPTNVFN